MQQNIQIYTYIKKINTTMFYKSLIRKHKLNKLGYNMGKSENKKKNGKNSQIS